MEINWALTRNEFHGLHPAEGMDSGQWVTLFFNAEG